MISEDARRIVAGWAAWGDEAMGKLKSRSEATAVNELLAHARDFATRQRKGNCWARFCDHDKARTCVRMSAR